jgi:putative endonuclease
MAEHNDIGKEGELEAKKYLKEKGYKILATNWRHRFNKAEIDIIAKKNEMVVMIEVKTRTTNTIEQPEDAVNNKKQKLLFKIADLYAQEKNVKEEIQFDIISLLKIGNQWKINHIENAFEDSF